MRAFLAVQSPFCFVLCPMRFQVRRDALKIFVRKLGVAIEAKEIGLPGERVTRALLAEQIEEALHPLTGATPPISSAGPLTSFWKRFQRANHRATLQSRHIRSTFRLRLQCQSLQH